MIFHLILYHVARTALYLLGDILAEFRRGKRFLLAFREHQVHGLHHDHRINLSSRLDLFLQTFECTDLIVHRLPVVARVADRVVADGRGRHVAHQLLVLELVEREAIAGLRTVIVLLDIGYDAFAHHQLHIGGREILLSVLVFCLEIVLDDVSLGDDVSAQSIVDNGNQGCRNQVGSQQALEADTGCQHGDNLTIACQLRREEDHRDKDEQR